MQQFLNLSSESDSVERDIGGVIDLLHMFLTYGTGRISHQEIAIEVRFWWKQSSSMPNNCGRKKIEEVISFGCFDCLCQGYWNERIR